MADGMPEDDCSICVDFKDDISILEVIGEIDLANLSLLAKALNFVVESGPQDILLDAHRLTYIDLPGIQTLLSWTNRMAEEGRQLAIVGCHGVFYKLIEGNQLKHRLYMYSNLDEAVSSLHHNRRVA